MTETTHQSFEEVKTSIRNERIAKAAAKIDKRLEKDAEFATELAKGVLTGYWGSAAYGKIGAWFAKTFEGATQEDIDAASERVNHYENIGVVGGPGAAAWERDFDDVEIAAIQDCFASIGVDPASVSITPGVVSLHVDTYAKMKEKLAQPDGFKVHVMPYLKAAMAKAHQTKLEVATAKIDKSLDKEAARAAQHAKGVLKAAWHDATPKGFDRWLDRKLFGLTDEKEAELATKVYHQEIAVAMPQYAHVHEFNALEVAAVRDQLQSLGENPSDLEVDTMNTRLHLPKETYARVQAKLTP